MKKLIICLLAFSLVGCVQFNHADIKAAEYACANKGGLERLTYNFMSGGHAHCGDTSLFHKNTAGKAYREYIKSLKEKNNEV